MPSLSQTATPWTWGTALRTITEALDEAGLGEGRRTAEWMLTEVLDVGRAALYAYPERPLLPEAQTRLEGWLRRRLAREPVQYILGAADFFGLRLRVTPDVLIPRPETETVAEAALARLEGVRAPRVLDVGTGSGCLALALKSRRPDADVWACDVSEAALAVARANAATLGLPIATRKADLLDASFAQTVGGPYNLIVSNPPYVPDAEAEALMPEVRDYEPALALFSGEDPLRFYRALAQKGLCLLGRGGWMVLETHTDYASAVQALFNGDAWTHVATEPDLSGRPRTVRAQRSERVQG